MPANPPLELSMAFSYDTLASFLVLDTPGRPHSPAGDGAAAPVEPAADSVVIARRQLFELFAAASRSVQR